MTSPNTFAAAGSPVDPAIRELDRRNGDGIDVRLFWDSQSNRVCVFVEDERSGESLRFGVAAADALEAFRHPYPYAYAGRQRAERRVSASAIEAR
jgi:YD repeat-containing protein